MAVNPIRRSALADAGIAVLAREGSRGLTHRAVDAEGRMPLGTASNYFRDRPALLQAIVLRIGERLAPDPRKLDGLAQLGTGRAAYVGFLRYIVERLLEDPSVALALLELRLESARRAEIAAVIGAWQREAFAGDIAFAAQAGLPGGAGEIALFHYAVDGLILDRLTTPIDPATPIDSVLEHLVDALLPPDSAVSDGSPESS